MNSIQSLVSLNYIRNIYAQYKIFINMVGNVTTFIREFQL